MFGARRHQHRMAILVETQIGQAVSTAQVRRSPGSILGSVCYLARLRRGRFAHPERGRNHRMFGYSWSWMTTRLHGGVAVAHPAQHEDCPDIYFGDYRIVRRGEQWVVEQVSNETMS